jgi:hypothetical protein
MHFGLDYFSPLRYRHERWRINDNVTSRPCPLHKVDTQSARAIVKLHVRDPEWRVYSLVACVEIKT